MENIEISPNDKRKYRCIKLKNNLEALLVEDAETEKSSACCDVRVGSLYDPDHAQGLAHFLEHMLFMGTRDYPVENEYSAFLNSHGGYSNAYTAQENTVYYFDVQSDSLEKALDMFASFFTCPLFNESSVTREIHAVDSENQKNLQSDSWRHYQLFKSLAQKSHPFSNFSTGNLATLEEAPKAQGLNIRNLMLKFYEDYYSANLMKLVVYGKESLDVLQKWVEDKFCYVVDKELVPRVFPSDPYAGQLSKYVEVVPIKDTKSLELEFLMPAYWQHYKSKPERYFSHLFGHESGGSILSALKTKSWATGLAAYQSQNLRDFSAMGIDIELTDEGVQHVPEIIATVFSYIGMLRAAGPQEWVQVELQNVMDMNFRFISKNEPSTYVTQLANNMQYFERNHYISGSRKVFAIDMHIIADMMTYFTPDNCIIMLKDKAFAGHTTQVEPVYGTNYNIRSFAEAEMAAWTRCCCFSAGAGAGSAEAAPTPLAHLLALPVPNPFVATNFELKATSAAAGASPAASDSASSSPELFFKGPGQLLRSDCIESALPKLPEDPGSPPTTATENGQEQGQEQQTQEQGEEEGEEGDDEGEGEGEGEGGYEPMELPSKGLTLWYKQDTHWKIPKLNVLITLETLEASNSPLSVAHADLLCSVLKDVLSEYSYYADCAGLHYDVTLARGGLELSFSGYNDKLHELVFRTAEEFSKLGMTLPTEGQEHPIKADFHARTRQALLRKYKNYRYSQPYNVCMIGAMCCMEELRWSDLDKYNALVGADLSSFRQFVRGFLKHLRVEVLVHGNATAEEARTLAQQFHTRLNHASPLPLALLPLRRPVALAAGINYHYLQHGARFNPKEANSGIENVYIVSDVESANKTLPNEPGTFSDKIRAEALATFTAHILSEPAFDQLRTKEQLGYIVHTAVKRLNCLVGVHVIIQSAVKPPTYLNARIEDFIETYVNTTLATMSPEEFQTNQTAVIDLLTEKPKNLNEECNKYFAEIKTGTYLFSRKLLVSQCVAALTREEVLSFARTYLLKGPSRKKLSSRLISAPHQAHIAARAATAATTATESNNSSSSSSDSNSAAEERDDDNVVVVRDPALFKRVMPLMPIETLDSAATFPLLAGDN